MKVQQFLEERSIWFEILKHRPTYTAQYMAHAVHVPGDNVAKTVVLKADGDYVVAVLQATHNVDLLKARTALGATALDIASEREFQSVFPDCELGALPPFGSQYGLKTLVDVPLALHEQMVFEGNTHREAIRMKYQDFESLEHPQVAAFSYHT